MWKSVNGRLIQTIDVSRVEFRTNISEEVLDRLDKKASEYNTHINYLLESGMVNVLESGIIIFDKKKRPKDRVQYNTTYDKELLDSVRKMAKEHNVFVNDFLEYSVDHIDFENLKKDSHRYRIEVGGSLS